MAKYAEWLIEPGWPTSSGLLLTSTSSGSLSTGIRTLLIYVACLGRVISVGFLAVSGATIWSSPRPKFWSRFGDSRLSFFFFLIHVYYWVTCPRHRPVVTTRLVTVTKHVVPKVAPRREAEARKTRPGEVNRRPHGSVVHKPKHGCGCG
ncbi:hypothetical protein EDB83DRAFT_299050 [Lactarius deliciosus]|nr:hypothetical protein EDB83DRAFT_299050 [Lactarius deliciosus]